MPVIEQFSAPGGLTEFTEANALLWSEYLSSRFFDRSKDGTPTENDGPRTQFFNPVTDEVEGPLATAVVTWSAFPRHVTISSISDPQRWRTADGSRSRQDEYCEWSVVRDADDNIVRVEFTSEGPEYWEVLAYLQPKTVMDLYRSLIGPDVDEALIFPGGNYDRTNPYNTVTDGGIVHLVQRANSLGAEIELGAGASIVRRRGGELVTDVQALIRCSRYGAPERHSDPHIGSEVNTLARAGHRVSLADPVGLFIAGCDFADFEMPTQNVVPADCWHVERGSEDRALRVRFEPPDGETFSVSEITVTGRPITYGAQIVDKMRVGLAAWASASTSHLAVVDGCVGDVPDLGMAPPAARLEAMLGLDHALRARR